MLVAHSSASMMRQLRHKLSIVLLLLLFCSGCREVVVYHETIKPAQRRVEIYYYHPTVIRNDTLIWYSPFAQIYEGNAELVKVNNGVVWRSTFMSGASLIAIYWRTEQVGQLQLSEEIRKFLSVLVDTTWVL